MRNLTKIVLILAACSLFTGCDEFGWNPLDTSVSAEDSANHPSAPTVLLTYDIPTLDNAASFYDEQRDTEKGVSIRRRTWRGPPDADIAASLMEIRRLDGKAMDWPPKPQEAVLLWDRLRQRDKVFQTLYESTNAIGPVLWQRFTMGPQICLVFSQGVAIDGTTISRQLIGYYCAASGEELTAGQAETVIRAVRVREGDPRLTSDG